MHVFTVDRYGRVTRDHGIRTVSVGPNPVRETLPLRFPGCACPFHHLEPQADDHQAPTVNAARAEAGWFLAQETPPRHRTVAGFGRDFASALARLIPQVERAAGEHELARAAQDAVGEARFLLGLAGRHDVGHVRELARCLVALGERYDMLATRTLT